MLRGKEASSWLLSRVLNPPIVHSNSPIPLNSPFHRWAIPPHNARMINLIKSLICRLLGHRYDLNAATRIYTCLRCGHTFQRLD